MSSATAVFKVDATTHTVTPWRDWQEWRTCKQLLLGEDTAADAAGLEGNSSAEVRTHQKKRAIHMVNVWRARGRVPLAVDSTAQLVELNMQHDYPPMQASGTPAVAASAHFSSSLQSRLQYSMALLRLVNGVLDPMQAKQHAQSVLTLAKQMQMPRVLVDLRHESTHQGLPSLQLLQHASVIALEWLSRHYWAAQAHALSRLDHSIRVHLKEYKREVEKEREKRDNRRAKKQQEAQAEDGDEDDEAAAAEEKPDITISINSGDAIMFDETSANEKGAITEKAQEALKTLFTTITSGHSLQHAETVVETKLLPMLLSDQFLLKPPKQRSVLHTPRPDSDPVPPTCSPL
jgi:hypothetical protein